MSTLFLIIFGIVLCVVLYFVYSSWSASTTYVKFKTPGSIFVHVLKAENLLPADSSGLSDPFCKVILNKESHSTSTKGNTLNPKWKSTFSFVIQPDTPLTNIVVEVWDDDTISRNDPLGQVEIPVSKILERFGKSNADVLAGKYMHQQWYPLQSLKGKPTRGRIYLGFHYTEGEPKPKKK